MKTYLLALSLLCGSPAFAAEPIAFNFAAVPLVSFMQATYSSLLGRDFVIAPEVLLLDKKITVKVKALDGAELPAFVDGILSSQGVESVKRGAIYYVGVKSAPVASAVAPGGNSDLVRDEPVPVDPVTVFRPLNRSVEFMVTVANAAYGGALARPAGSVVVIAAPKSRASEMLSFLASVDVAPKVVEVSASFVEVSRSGSSSRGVSLAASVLGARLGVSVGSGAGAVSLKAAKFELVLDALAADGRFKQVSNSRVVGDESERMSLIVGDETPTVQSSGVDNQGNRVQSIIYRPSGVILDVLPRVLGSSKLSLMVDGQISSFQATVTGVTGSPTLIKRQVKTSVTVADGEVLIIGGLDDLKDSESVSGLSFLPRSWGAKSGNSSKTDLVLILSAKVLN